jgi:hypothetical protein
MMPLTTVCTAKLTYAFFIIATLPC